MLSTSWQGTPLTHVSETAKCQATTIKTPTAASVRNVDMRVGMNAERKADTVIRMNMAVVNNNKAVTEEVTNSTEGANPDTRVDIMSAERRVNTEEGIKMSTAGPVVVMKVIMAVVTRTIIAVDGDKRDTVEVDKVKMTMALASNKEVMEEATSSMVAASVDMSAERKVDMEETKMSTVVPVDIREIMEITRTIIAAVASKEDMAEAGIFPREEVMEVVVVTEEATTISAALLNMLKSMRDILMTAEYIPTF
jgi:hypothetical protein